MNFKNKLDLGINSKHRVIMSAIDDIFEGEFIQYFEDEKIPPYSKSISNLGYYEFFYI